MAPGALFTRAVFAVVLVSGFQFCCKAYPSVWHSAGTRAAFGITLPEIPTCLTQPTIDVGPPSPHGSPTPDSGITFTFSDAASGDPVSGALCPGRSYKVKVSYGGASRISLLTAAPAVAIFTAPLPTEGCPNQVDFNNVGASTSHEGTFRVPCSAAGTNITFKVTSAGTVPQWRQSSATVSIASLSSSEGSCAAAAAACSICSESWLGYQCAREWRNVTIHWTMNTTAAPINTCTPKPGTVLQAEDVQQYGTLHVAVTAQVSGYVALAFASVPGQMKYSDVILGFINTTTEGGPLALLNTFHVSNRSTLNADNNNNTANSWAYNTGVLEEGGVTTICFSRRLYDERARASPDLRASTDRLAINYAVSADDVLRRHLPGNVGGFWMDLPQVDLPQDGTAAPPQLVPATPPAQGTAPPPAYGTVSPPPPAGTTTPPAYGAPPSPVTAPRDAPDGSSVGKDQSSKKNCTSSSLGYDCSFEKANVTIHWTFNSTVAPASPCNPNPSTVLKAEDVQQYGTIHMAVTAKASGYVSIAFASVPGQMRYSDVILGFINTTTEGGPTSLLNTFHVSNRSTLNADNNNTVNSWAYDTGVIEEGGVTTICFSRRLYDERAKASPDLRASTDRLAINYAVSVDDVLRRHRPGNVGGFWMDLQQTATLPPSRDQDGDGDGAPVSTEPPSATKKSCLASNLGYDCMVQQGKVTLHWSLNKPTAPAGNGCTPANLTTLQAADVAQNGTLHMAVQSAAPGYVAMGFNFNPNDMYPSDIVLGWASTGGPFSNTYHVRSNGLTANNANPSDGSPSWAYDRGVMYDAAAGVTTLCFSRRLVDARALSSSDISAAVGGTPAQQQAAASGRRRLLQATQDGSKLGIIWAISDVAGLQQHTDENAGGFYLDVQSGSALAVGDSSKQNWINTHGALMAVAWAFLLPLGTLMPAHRHTLFRGAQTKTPLGNKEWWFLVHMVCQLTGIALFVAGFVIAFVKLDSGLADARRELKDAHEGIGISIMAAAGAQVVFAFIRPAPGAPKRPIWNLIHHNLGRITVLLAWANVYIGIYLYHVSPFGASLTEWITPIAIVMGLLVITDVVLRIFGPAAPLQQQKGSVPAGPNPPQLPPDTVRYGGLPDGAALIQTPDETPRNDNTPRNNGKPLAA